MMGLQSKPSQIFVNGKPLGIAENVHFSTEDPVSDFKPGSYHNTVTLEVKSADMGPELKKIFDELNQEYKKAMDIQKRLKELLTEVGKMVPTLLVIGTTADKLGVLLMGSPEENDEKRRVDLCAAIAAMMEHKQELRVVIFSVVSRFMEMHPEYQAKMYKALELMKKPHPIATKGEA